MRFIKSVILTLVMLLPAFAQNSISPLKTDELPVLNHFDPGIVDRTQDPCSDFYKFACSKWQAANPIPPDQAAWGTASNLQLWNESVLRNIMVRPPMPAPAAHPSTRRSATIGTRA